MESFGGNERRMPNCPYVWVLCENVTQENTKLREKKGGWNENRAACNAVCSCNLHRGREVAANCDIANRLEKGEKGFAWSSVSGVVGPGRF